MLIFVPAPATHGKINPGTHYHNPRGRLVPLIAQVHAQRETEPSTCRIPSDDDVFWRDRQRRCEQAEVAVEYVKEGKGKGVFRRKAVGYGWTRQLFQIPPRGLTKNASITSLAYADSHHSMGSSVPHIVRPSVNVVYHPLPHRSTLPSRPRRLGLGVNVWAIPPCPNIGTRNARRRLVR